MGKESDALMEMPAFITVEIVMKTAGNENIGERPKYMKAQARINPLHIYSYHPGQYTDDEDEKHTITHVTCGSGSYYVDMPIEKFDELMAKTMRGYLVKHLPE